MLTVQKMKNEHLCRVNSAVFYDYEEPSDGDPNQKSKPKWIFTFTNSEQLNIAFVRYSIDNRKKLCIQMREPWRQRGGGDREREKNGWIPLD
jgi:hypothetical protein